MRLPRVVGLAILFLAVLQLDSYPLQLGPESVPASPSVQNIPDLNLLSLRVREFWTLLQQGRKQEALSYVDPASRNEFLKRREPEFFSFRLGQIRFEAGSDAVMVTVLALRLFPQFPNPLEWPVEERYLYRDGLWYVQIAQADAKIPFATPNPAESPKPDPAAVKQIEQELSRVQILPEKLDLGKAEQGGLLRREIQIINNSSIPVVVEIIQKPANCIIDQFPFKLAPGKTAAVTMKAQTQFIQGKFAGDVVALLKSDGVEARRIISVEGEVQSPLYFTQFPLVLANSMHEVKITNTTSKAIQIRDVVTPGAFMTVEWRSESDKKLAAGGTAAFMIRWDAQKQPKDWPGGMIEFQFEGTVDGRPSVSLPVEMPPSSGTAPNK